jgi:glucose-6-phosphate-specific signal transduction histidine kinase
LLRLRVTDDGVGFQTGASTRPNSFGLAGMQERVCASGGKARDSKPARSPDRDSRGPASRSGSERVGSG